MQEITVGMKKRFLRELANMPIPARASQLSKIELIDAFAMRESDSDFKAQWDEAFEIGVSKLEEEAIKRAREGSDRLLIEMLRALKPDKYSDHVGVDGNMDVDIQVVWDDRES